jgi:hypothetical protein
MKRARIINGLLATLLFILVLVFTNDHVKEQVPFANQILLGILFLLISLSVVNLLYLRKK